MMLKHDEQGFLVGPREQTDELLDQLKLIRGELEAIRATLGDAKPQEAATTPASSPDVQRPPVVTPGGRHGGEPGSTLAATAALAPVVVLRQGDSYQHGGDTHFRQGDRSTSSSIALTDRQTINHSAPSAREAATTPASSPDVQRPPVVTPIGRVGPKRDENGRFVKASSPQSFGAARSDRDEKGRFVGSGDDDSAANELGLRTAIGDMGDRIAGAVHEMALNEEADPSVKAFNEVAQPLSRGFSKIFGGEGDKGQERWFRRIWRQMRESREAGRQESKQTITLLEDIEKQQGGKDRSGGGWFALALAPAMVLLRAILTALLPMALLKRLPAWLTGIGAGKGGPGAGKWAPGRAGGGAAAGATGAASAGAGRPGAPDARGAGSKPGMLRRAGRFARRVPVLGSLIGLGYMASDIYSSESSNDSRQQKDVSTGAAIGRGTGALGGAMAGGAAGAALGSVVPVVGNIVGGIVGAAVGAWLGESAGEVIGAQFGSWVADLRDSNFVQGMSDAWRTMTLFTGHLWGQVSGAVGELWGAMSETVGAAWSSVSSTVSSAWLATSDAVSATWDGIAGAITSTWDSAVGVMTSAWDSVTSKLEGWWDSISEAGQKVNDWIKEKTGIDVKETATAVYDSTASALKEAGGNAWSFVKKSASTVGEATGVSKAYRAIKRSANYAKNRSALEKQMAASGITDPAEQAMFMAQMDHESGGMTSLEESFNYRNADRLMAVSATARKKGPKAVQAAIDQGPEAVAELMYGGRMGNTEPGDGYKFRGRGFTQLTGRNNYEAASKDLGIDLVNNPDMAADPEVAAKIATWYWQQRPGLSDAAKRGDVEEVTRKINGGTNGLADRKAKTEQYLAEYRDRPIAPTSKPEAVALAQVDAPARATNSITRREITDPAEKAAALAELERDLAWMNESMGHGGEVTPEGLAGMTSPNVAPAARVPDSNLSQILLPPVSTSVDAARLPPMAMGVMAPAAPPAVAAAPNLTVPLRDNAKPKASRPPQDVSRDLPDRQIAHIVTGAYAAM
ncbi:hypothetical protein PU634_05235 [Oceanimonas pelagia]|uniref:Glycoside hydrolase family 19 catalytic domain-containing protein n=1 Tax=Oceanimonas pelagia TaxID=3028314 RepID=A0AA50KRK6_9GAMM|nr:glycoside hydrolase family 19 protein [Oceanimonas pelagia]WMC11772.1 hypothetical protein PU634_05235 [Oceanimonas pelagia]